MLTVIWDENTGSRNIDVTIDNFEQEFKLTICGNFHEEADVDPDFGRLDDVVVLQTIYGIIPNFRVMPTYAGIPIILTFTALNVRQIDADVWEFICRYSVKQRGGNGFPENPDEGPQAGDYQRWSNEFVQLSFNVTSQQQNRKMSIRTKACQKATSIANQNVPYPPGKPAPIGHTVDGIEGSNVYMRGFSFSITSFFSPDRLTFAYLRRLYRMATSLNNDVFFGFPKGSVLYLEGSASSDLYSNVPVTFDFAMQPNFIFSANPADDNRLSNPDFDNPLLMYDMYYDPDFPPAVAGNIDARYPNYDENAATVVGAYSGWCDVDYRFVESVDEDSQYPIQKPVLRTIHENYNYADFGKFEI